MKDAACSVIPDIRRSVRLACLAGLIAVVVWFPGTSASAQAASPEMPETKATVDPETGAQASQAIPLEKVPDRAEDTSAELDALLPSEASRQALERIVSELDGILREVKSSLAKTREALAARPNVRTLQRLEVELGEMAERLRPWNEELDSELAGLYAALQRLEAIAVVWEATAEIARREDAVETAVTRIATARDEIDKVRSTVVKRRDQILTVRDRLVDPSSALAASLEQVRSAIEARLQGVFRVDRPPLWSPQVRESLREEWKASGPQRFLRRLQKSAQHAREQWRVLGFQLALFVALFLGLRSLRDRARALAERTTTTCGTPWRSSSVRGRWPC